MIIYPEVEMSYDERKSIFDNIKQLSKPEQEEIYRILRKTKETYTENSNGIFLTCRPFPRMPSCK